MAINLISENQKKELEKERTQSQVLTLFVFLAFCSVIFVFILLSLHYYVSAKNVALSDLVLEKNQELQSVRLKESEEIIKEANQDLSQVAIISREQILISNFLKKISDLTPLSVYLTDIDCTKKQRQIEDSKGEKQIELFLEIKITGIAQTRESLYNFRSILLKEHSFSAIYFSPPSWAKAENAEFSLSLDFLL